MAINFVIDTTGAVKALKEVEGALDSVEKKAEKAYEAMQKAFGGAQSKGSSSVKERKEEALGMVEALDRQTASIKNLLAKQQDEISIMLKLASAAKKLSEAQKESTAGEQSVIDKLRARIKGQAELANATRELVLSGDKSVIADLKAIEVGKKFSAILRERMAILGELKARKEADLVITNQSTLAALRKVSAEKELERIEKSLATTKGTRFALQGNKDTAVELATEKARESDIRRLIQAEGELAALKSKRARASLRATEVAQQEVRTIREEARASASLKVAIEDLAKGKDSLIRKQIVASTRTKNLRDALRAEIEATEKSVISSRRRLEVAKLMNSLKQKELELEAQLKVSKERLASGAAAKTAKELRELEILRLKEAQMVKLAKLEALQVVQNDKASAAIRKKISELERELGVMKKTTTGTKGSRAEISAWAAANKKAAVFAAEFRAALNALGLGFGIFTGSTIIAATAIFGTVRAIRGVIESGAKFEFTMDRAKAVMSATASESLRLDSEVKRLAKTTVFTANEVSEGLVFLGMAGFNTNEALLALDPTLKLAQIGMVDMAQAADQVTNIMAAFGVSAAGISEVVDKLSVVVTSSNTSMSQLAQAISFVGPAAAETATSLDEVAAIIGVFANRGVKASRAGTALRRGIANLANPTQKVRDRLSKLGVVVQGVDGRMRSMKDILIDLADSGATVNDIFSIFGTRAGPTFAGAILSGKEELVSLLEKIENTKDAAKGLQEKLQDNVWTEFKLVVSAITDVAIKLYERLQGPLRAALVLVKNTFITLSENVDKVAFAFKVLLTFGLFKLAKGLRSLAVGAMRDYISSITVANLRTAKFVPIAEAAATQGLAPFSMTMRAATASTSALNVALRAGKALLRTFLPFAVIATIWELVDAFDNYDEAARRAKKTTSELLPVLNDLKELGKGGNAVKSAIDIASEDPSKALEKAISDSESVGQVFQKAIKAREDLKASLERAKVKQTAALALGTLFGFDTRATMKEISETQQKLKVVDSQLDKLYTAMEAIGEKSLNSTVAQLREENRQKKVAEEAEAKRREAIKSLKSNYQKSVDEFLDLLGLVTGQKENLVERLKTQATIQQKEFNDAITLMLSGGDLAATRGKIKAQETLDVLKALAKEAKDRRDAVREFVISEIRKNVKSNTEAKRLFLSTLEATGNVNKALAEANKTGAISDIEEFKGALLQKINDQLNLSAKDFDNFDQFISFYENLSKAAGTLGERAKRAQDKLRDAFSTLSARNLVEFTDSALNAEKDKLKATLKALEDTTNNAIDILRQRFDAGLINVDEVVSEASRIQRSALSESKAAYEEERTVIEFNIRRLEERLTLVSEDAKATKTLTAALKRQKKALDSVNSAIQQISVSQGTVEETAIIDTLNKGIRSISRYNLGLETQVESYKDLQDRVGRATKMYNANREALEQLAETGGTEEVRNLAKEFLLLLKTASKTEKQLVALQLSWQPKDMAQEAVSAATKMGDAFTEFFIDPTLDGLERLENAFLNLVKQIIAQNITNALFKTKDKGGFGFGDFFTGLFKIGQDSNKSTNSDAIKVGSGGSSKTFNSPKLTGISSGSIGGATAVTPTGVVVPDTTFIKPTNGSEGAGAPIVNNFYITVGDVADKGFVRQEIQRSIDISVAKVADQQQRRKKPLGVR